MENKIAILIKLVREYFEDKHLTVEFKICDGKTYVESAGCEWGGDSFEQALDEAIKEVTEWIEEDNQEEWEQEDEIAKAVDKIYENQ